ncbi:integrase [Rhizobium leguminosarum bv. viciae]|nr:integrase [Rhizobium sp. L18]TBY48612.1 integrase [Rhizobium leguminosarum bv. viciae]
MTPTSLIPVLVTGFHSRRVRAVNESVPKEKRSFAPNDLGALDSCDKHRNEGGEPT